MATGGGKPGITARVIVRAAYGHEVAFEFENAEDAEYFKIGNGYVAFFMPTPTEHSGSGSGEQGNG